MKRHDIEERALAFACRVSKIEQFLACKRRVKRRTLDQMTSASSSIGANLEEARGAQSRADFHAKIRIALKEAREAKYWFRYIATSSGLPLQRFTALITEAGEIVAILTTIAKKTNPKADAILRLNFEL